MRQIRYGLAVAGSRGTVPVVMPASKALVSHGIGASRRATLSEHRRSTPRERRGSGDNSSSQASLAVNERISLTTSTTSVRPSPTPLYPRLPSFMTTVCTCSALRFPRRGFRYSNSPSNSICNGSNPLSRFGLVYRNDGVGAFSRDPRRAPVGRIWKLSSATLVT